MAENKPNSKKVKKDSLRDSRPPTDAKSKLTRPRWNAGRVFWGLLFLTLGTLALLDALKFLEVNFFNLFRLWPLVIVAFGLSLLKLQGVFSRVVTSVFIAAAILAVLFVSLDTRPNLDVRSQSVQAQVIEAAEYLHVSFKGGAGNVEINSSKGDVAAAAVLDSNFAELSHSSRQDGDRQTVEFRTHHRAQWWRGDWRSDMKLTLTEDLPVELVLDTGAARLTGDLTGLALRRLDIDSGASDISLRLGARSPHTSVLVEAGASSIELFVPNGSGVRVHMTSGLGSVSLPGLTEVSEGTFETDNYDSAGHKVSIEGSIGVASFNLSRY